MRTPLVFCTVVLVLAAFSACGGSSSEDDGAAGASSGGADCATDADCADPTPKCTRAGECVYENQCDTDADCRGDYKFCDTFGQCEPCRVDADCPPETPACVPGWESGVYCAECRTGVPSVCPPYTVCTPTFPSAGGGGRCEAPACATEPTGGPCAACINQSANLCLYDGVCDGARATLDACYAGEIPGWTSSDCPTGVFPAIRGCTPEACFDEAEAFDACMLACEPVATICE
jgi:hypothetical protein